MAADVSIHSMLLLQYKNYTHIHRNRSFHSMMSNIHLHQESWVPWNIQIFIPLFFDIQDSNLSMYILELMEQNIDFHNHLLNQVSLWLLIYLILIIVSHDHMNICFCCKFPNSYYKFYSYVCNIIPYEFLRIHRLYHQFNLIIYYWLLLGHSIIHYYLIISEQSSDYYWKLFA